MPLNKISEIAKAIPDKLWNKMVSIACTAFQQILAPLTKMTIGFGRLIRVKLDAWKDAEAITYNLKFFSGII